MRKGNISAGSKDVWIFNGLCFINYTEQSSKWWKMFTGSIFAPKKCKLDSCVERVHLEQIDTLRERFNIGIKVYLIGEGDSDFFEIVPSLWYIIEEVQSDTSIKRYIDNDLERLQTVRDLHIHNLIVEQFTDWNNFMVNL